MKLALILLLACFLVGCGESLPPPKLPSVSSEPAPEEKPTEAEPEVAPATEGPQKLLADFVDAANRSDHAAFQNLVRPACWSGACQGFAQQAGKKFQVKLVGSPAENAERATAVADIVVAGEVRDRVYLYLVKGTEGWRVVDIDEDANRSRTFLVEHEVFGNQTTPEETVKAYFSAAEVGEKAHLLELFTEAGRAKEREWEKSFSNAMFSRGMKLKEWKIRDVKVDGDAATVRARVVFTDAKGEDDNEGMGFSLSKQSGKWWISAVE